jgi:hypothetical protein
MKKTLVALVLAACAAPAAFADPSVSVSIGINQPGVYGRIDIGRYPHPAVVYAKPVVVAPAPVAVVRQPIYLYVPVAHQRSWSRYCGRYAACGQPVYFVKDEWVRERYRYEHRHDHDHRDHRDRHDHHDDRRGPDRDRHGPDRDHRDDGRRDGDRRPN